MKKIHTLHVTPSLPEPLTRLRDVALNLRWTWHPESIELFRRLDQDLWREVGHNPITLLAKIPQQRLTEAAEDEGFLNHLERVWTDLEFYKTDTTWFHRKFSENSNLKVAYLSAEFGLHECVPIYSGGLGVLAGDHLKAASDLGVPLTAIGLMYQKGYFRQYLNADGWQGEHYVETDLYHTPVELVKSDKGVPVEFTIYLAPREVRVHIWKTKVGVIDLYLLDTNVIQNELEDRRITANLYGGDTELRIKQEIVLGIGGIRALTILGIDSNVFHMNEGHSAFLALERIRVLMAENHLSFSEAREAAQAGQVFTTHTPVPAGIDRFSQELIVKYFENFWPEIGLDKKGFMEIGGTDPSTPDVPFNMAILAINLASMVNGVSTLHAEVSRGMWGGQWPDLPEHEIPIIGVNNGVHARSWISQDISMILDRYLGRKWSERPFDADTWHDIASISTEEFWRIKERSRARLVEFTRNRLQSQLTNRGEQREAILRAGEVLDMDTLTIGFARRFATYKRAFLLFSDPERLIKILTNPDRPVQLIIAGKAHPKDEPGKAIIREIFHFARNPLLKNKIVFLEDYDINVARYMVQGCDVWLNTPRRPFEASGTSGMKAAMNGVLNFSTLDGWWADVFSPEIGWSIGDGEQYEEDEYDYQDKIEAESLYDKLENEIVPLFYRRDKAKVARHWTEMIKTMMEKIYPLYLASRMVNDYTRLAYRPASERAAVLFDAEFKAAKNLAKWREKVYAGWNKVEITHVESAEDSELTAGESLSVVAKVKIGKLKPEDIQVEAYTGRLGGSRELKNGESFVLEYQKNDINGDSVFAGEIVCHESGNIGYTIRVFPRHENLISGRQISHIIWE